MYHSSRTSFLICLGSIFCSLTAYAQDSEDTPPKVQAGDSEGDASTEGDGSKKDASSDAEAGQEANETQPGDESPVAPDDSEEAVAEEPSVQPGEESIESPEEASGAEPLEEDEGLAPSDEEAEREVIDDSESTEGFDEEGLEAPPGVEGMWAPGEEPFRPAPEGMGVVWGRILEPDSGEGALEAQLTVQGRNIEVIGDFDGYYRLELPPGTYTVEVFYPLHEKEVLSNIVVTKGELSRVDTTLRSQEGAIDTVVIEEEANTETLEGLALARQRSAAQGDAVGREEISKTTDGNAAEAAQRIVGANIVGGRFVYVRGLGERYSNSLLSGYPLPSPEPDRAAVPLDVFPTPILNSLTIVKTFTPDMPGDFAGGSVQIETRSVPSEPLFKVSLTGGANTQSTFQKRLTQPSSSTDWLGFDSGMRKLPDSVPTDYPAIAQSEKPDGSRVEAEELVAPGRDMNSRMSPRMKGTPINHGFGVVAGNTWEFGQSKLGVLASLNYSHKYEKYEDVILNSYESNTNDERLYSERLRYEYDQGVEKIRWGAFGKVSFMPTSDHDISLTGLHSQLADDITTQYNGFNVETEKDYQISQLDWIERGLTFGLASGRHTFRPLKDAEFSWDASIAKAYRSQPDRRDTAYSFNDRMVDPDDDTGRISGWTYVNKSESGRHFWADQTENSYGGKLDWLQHVIEGDKSLDIKGGGLVNIKRRKFKVRRFQMYPNQGRDSAYDCAGETYRLECPDQLFQDENIDSYIELNEGTQTTDAYDADLDVYAGYLMGDMDFDEKLRLTAGARIEWTEQTIDPYDQYGSSSVEGAELSSTDALPSVSAVYSATDKIKLRASYAHTLARPQVRELAPFAFADYFGGTVTTGNPDLKLTNIKNVDARFEYWPSLTEVLAVTAFYKALKDPIESLQVPTPGIPQVTYENADRADVLGLELEVRKNLGFMTSSLKHFQVISNFTYTWSRTEVDEADGNSILTNSKRPLINQAPWVYNLAIDYRNDVGTGARIGYNVNGPTLVRVGTFALPDAYKRSFHSLDLAVSQNFLEHWSVKAMVENLINDKVQETQGKDFEDNDKDGQWDNVALEYTKGTVISLGVSYEL